MEVLPEFKQTTGFFETPATVYGTPLSQFNFDVCVPSGILTLLSHAVQHSHDQYGLAGTLSPEPEPESVVVRTPSQRRVPHDFHHKTGTCGVHRMTQ